MGLPSTRQADARLLESNAAPNAQRRRRRRRGAGSAEESGDTNGVSGEDGATAAARKPSGASPKKLLTELRQDNFFDSGKTQAEMVAELDKRGHTKILPTSLPGALTKLVQDTVLSRHKSEEGVWVYTSGANNG